MRILRPFSCGTFGSGGIVLMSSGTKVFGSSCANRTRYSTPPTCSNAIWIASRIDWFTLFGVPFARPPQRVPFGGLGGIAGPEEMGAVREPDGADPLSQQVQPSFFTKSSRAGCTWRRTGPTQRRKVDQSVVRWFTQGVKHLETGPMKLIRPLMAAGLIVKHGTAKTGRCFLP